MPLGVQQDGQLPVTVLEAAVVGAEGTCHMGCSTEPGIRPSPFSSPLETSLNHTIKN